MALTRANLASLLVPGLRKVFWLRYNLRGDEFARIFNIQRSNRKYEDDRGVAGFGTMPSKPEGVAVSYDTMTEGYTKRYTHTTYGMGVRLTQELYEDELYKVMNRLVEALARSARYTVEQQAANVLNNGFTDTGPDALSLFNTAHTLAGDSATFANTPSTQADLSVASLQAGLIRFAKQVDDRNLLLAIQPQHLVVHVNDMFLAQEILRSPQKPFTADNEVNVLKGALALEINHFLTDTDAWFILAGKGDHELNFFWRRSIQDEADNDFDKQTPSRRIANKAWLN